MMSWFVVASRSAVMDTTRGRTSDRRPVCRGRFVWVGLSKFVSSGGGSRSQSDADTRYGMSSSSVMGAAAPTMGASKSGLISSESSRSDTGSVAIELSSLWSSMWSYDVPQLLLPLGTDCSESDSVEYVEVVGSVILLLSTPVGVVMLVVVKIGGDPLGDSEWCWTEGKSIGRVLRIELRSHVEVRRGGPDRRSSVAVEVGSE